MVLLIFEKMAQIMYEKNYSELNKKEKRHVRLCCVPFNYGISGEELKVTENE